MLFFYGVFIALFFLSTLYLKYVDDASDEFSAVGSGILSFFLMCFLLFLDYKFDMYFFFGEEKEQNQTFYYMSQQPETYTFYYLDYKDDPDTGEKKEFVKEEVFNKDNIIFKIYTDSNTTYPYYDPTGTYGQIYGQIFGSNRTFNHINIYLPKDFVISDQNNLIFESDDFKYKEEKGAGYLDKVYFIDNEYIIYTSKNHRHKTYRVKINDETKVIVKHEDIKEGYFNFKQVVSPNGKVSPFEKDQYLNITLPLNEKVLF
tara:strand:- start:5211 stop:5987 length:777 start_codon:yes stop_codon:yes gene_type:complete